MSAASIESARTVAETGLLAWYSARVTRRSRHQVFSTAPAPTMPTAIASTTRSVRALWCHASRRTLRQRGASSPAGRPTRRTPLRMWALDAAVVQDDGAGGVALGAALV